MKKKVSKTNPAGGTLSERPRAGLRAMRPAAEATPKAAKTKRPARGWLWLLGALAAALLAYGPSMRAAFVFDDLNLPFALPNAAALPWQAWLLGVRPLLMASYFFNYKLFGTDTLSYHFVNVLLHTCTAALIFLALRRLLDWAGVASPLRTVIALGGAGVFLLHPVQTEAVSYVAGRSETLSVLLFYLAFVLFLYRRERTASWGVSLVVIVLLGMAATTKEHTVVLPALLLLTDYFWNPGFSFRGAVRNWRLYVPALALGGAGALYVVTHVTAASAAGFSIKEFTWYQYLFTEFRAIFIYLRLFLLPVNQTIDYDLPISHGILEYGALFYGIALAGLIGAAIFYRKRYPLAAYGFLLFLVLLLPTSSVVPIKDALAERRMYLPFLGLLLIAAEFLRRVRVSRTALAAGLAGVCVVFGFLTYERNQVWTSWERLWQEAVEKSPTNARARLGLGDAYVLSGRCAAARKSFEEGAKVMTPDYRYLLNWAYADECANALPAAREVLMRAAQLDRTADVLMRIGRLYSKQGQVEQAFTYYGEALEADPNAVNVYVNRGTLQLALKHWGEAEADYQKALALDPANAGAIKGMSFVQQHKAAASDSQ